MTAVFQLLVFVAAAFVFAWFVLRRDGQEHPRTEARGAQQSFYPPDRRPSDEQETRGAAMSRLK